ncbi:MAG: NAD-dependent succinate-semialdehyde dehydrogenase [Flavobacteriaceae bacterium]|nr:NAD-dependent succinate-semialdehyde dehydrogenase [Flavobacteriaceae bacterium]
METIETRNPYNGEKLQEYKLYSDSQIEEKLKAAEDCFRDWRFKSIEDRIQPLKNLSRLLLDQKKELGRLITSEMGKPLSESIAEIEKCSFLCDFYVENAALLLADEIIETDAQQSFISYDPLGCILAVMPWNFPFWQVMRFAVPTLTAGNTGLLKHSSNTTGCSLKIEELFAQAGYPKGAFGSLICNHDQLEKIIGNDIIKAVTLTGSEKAGKKIAATAGKHLKKTVLELGGNNACIILEDAELDKFMDTIVKARMQNTGQSCIAAKRFIVVESIYDDFISKFKKSVENLKSGNPLDDVDISVLAKAEHAESLKEQVDKSVEKGAKVLIGNSRDDAYFAPTIVENSQPGMAIFDEETFGPVAAITKVKNQDEAIEMANNSRFGLGTMLISKDTAKALKLCGQIEDGAYFINELVKSDPRLPFGGTKNSGYGRELSREGILEFVNKKTVYIKN